LSDDVEGIGAGAGRGASKKILILAGPNGAGKTTFAREFLPGEAQCPQFVNADLIASGLSPFAPERAAFAAGRIMLERIAELVERRESFGFETTLSGRSYARRIPEWQSIGYRVTLYFLALSSAEVAVARVVERVRGGGHNVPEEMIRRRIIESRKNFDNIYRALVSR